MHKHNNKPDMSSLIIWLIFVFNGKYIPIEFLMQTDGMFRWNTTLVYYVKNYNIKLPEEFMRKILQENS